MKRPDLMERGRTAERLLTRGNTLAVTVSNLLFLLAEGGRELDPAEIRRYSDELRDWARDVRAVAEEEHG